MRQDLRFVEPLQGVRKVKMGSVGGCLTFELPGKNDLRELRLNHFKVCGLII